MNRQVFNSLQGGAPFRTMRAQPPVIKNGAPETQQPQVVGDPESLVLELNKPEDLRKLNDVMAMYSGRKAVIHVFEKIYCEDIGSWRVFLVYFKLFQEMPDETQRRWDQFYNENGCL